MPYIQTIRVVNNFFKPYELAAFHALVTLSLNANPRMTMIIY